MNILFIGDIVGRPGRSAVKALLPGIKDELNVDLILANGENLASGIGMTYEKYNEMRDAGIEYFTGGNHIFTKKEFLPYLDDPDIHVIRPANYVDAPAGRGAAVFEWWGKRVHIINLAGAAFMNEPTSDVFTCADELLSDQKSDIQIVDFHAEATSEKAILSHYLDGRVTVFLGTHTHIQTADERILPKGTAFQTDVGMTGPIDSTLGAQIAPYYDMMRYGHPAKYEVASGSVTFNSTLIRINDNNKAESIERVHRIWSP